ncbi:hypothetical protein HCN44_001388 [Aphidius gifuensis]|uniref:CCDC66 domain-containing protein n=1 Tax=Aphidius gifuensis TaxID=684658 RepID=A0A834XTA1_APHGI|nr:hypothetical protein HCN44_001388 [Aphidius gifuensis]
MTKRLTLVEQKKIQWAKEKEEMARLNNHWDLIKHHNPVRTTIRTRLSSREQSSSCNQKIVRASGQYGSTTSLQSLEFSAGGSMINILDRNEFTGTMRTRSPSLPPIYTKENHHHHHQQQQQQQHANNSQKILQLKGDKTTRDAKYKNGSSKNMPYELEREDETSGYASDSVEAPVNIYPAMINNDNVMSSEKTWKNPYCEMPNTTTTTTAGSVSETSRGCSITRLGDINRQRWGSVWQGESSKDPPQHSWLERGLSRLDNSSQILVINHENTSSPDSSTTGSSNCDSKTYLRGHNIPVDIHILEERELRRQKALQLQNAIKQQLEENDKKRKEEKIKKQQEEYEEEERIKKERCLERERLEQEEKKMKEKEEAKIKKEEAMRKIIENAEKLAKEEKRHRRQVNDSTEHIKEVNDHLPSKVTTTIDVHKVQENQSTTIDYTPNNNNNNNNSQEKNDEKIKENINININNEEKNINNNKDLNFEILDNLKMKNLLRLPVNNEVAIVLTGRLDDSDLLNLVVNTKSDLSKNNYYSNSIINEFIKNPLTDSSCSPKDKTIEYRLLTPSKYRSLMTARECATQTDGENETFNQQKNNNNRKNNEKSTSTNEEKCARSKSQPRASIDSRPRWNANRPGTRYRTQSEKDPHYQRRLRMRRRRIESSDDRSRSPSSERRKINNIKLKIRNLTRRNIKNNHSDADLSMDSLNSIVPLRIDENGRINVHNNELIIEKNKINDKVDSWHEHDIISQLVTLKNGLLAKQQEWDSERCLISPSADIY